MARPLHATCRQFYEEGGYIAKRRESAQEKRDRVKMALYGSSQWDREGFADGGALGRVLRGLRNTQGVEAAQRLEKASDLTDMSRFQPKALSEMFGKPSGLFTTMAPGDFEKFARPIRQMALDHVPYSRWDSSAPASARKAFGAEGPLDYDSYVRNIGNQIETRGMGEPPTLWLGKQGARPNIAGHEGRHRMRALDQLGDDSSLVNLRPANFGELKGDPGDAAAAMLEKYFGNNPSSQKFWPEEHILMPRSAVTFPEDVFAGGGRVGFSDGGATARFLRRLLPAGSGYEPKMGLPSKLRLPDVGLVEPRPLPDVEQAAKDYYRKAFGAALDTTTPLTPLNEDFSRKVAGAYDALGSSPRHPQAKRAYDSLIDETMAQYKALENLGYDFRFHTPTSGDPYAASPGLGLKDLTENRRLWVYPTDEGFGSGIGDSSSNPLLKRVGRVGDLPNATANDAFRIVHDMYGHFGSGNPFFRAPGEERAYQLHRRMYSPEAARAAATETRGQNSWVNFGPFSEQNLGASGADTRYAPQSFNLLPEWAEQLPPVDKAGGGRIGFGDGGVTSRLLRSWRTAAAERLAKQAEELNAGRDIKLPFLSPDVNKRLQTVKDPSRIMFPGIYKDVPDLLSDARARMIPDPGEEGAMARLFGHTRQSLDQLAQDNRFLQGVGPPQMPWEAPARARGADVSEQVLTDRNARRVQDVIGGALEDPDLRATRSWYEMQPLYDWMSKQGLGIDTQRGLNTRMGVMSPGSNPVTEINRGFHAHYLAPQGRTEDLAQFGAKAVKDRPDYFPEDLTGLQPHPYMNTAAMPNLRSFESTGQLSSSKHKVPTYVMATDPVWDLSSRPIADAHFTRFLGYPDVRGANQTAGLRKELSNSEYGDMLPWWSKKIADPLGMSERDAQALMWNVGGPQTGVRYIGAPKLEMISNYIDDASKRLNLPLDETAYKLLSGESPGYFEGGRTAFGEGGRVFARRPPRDHQLYHTSMWQEDWG